MDSNDKFHVFKKFINFQNSCFQNKLFIDAMDTVAPLKQIRIKKNNNLPYFDSELRFHTNERNKIHYFALGFPKCDPIWVRIKIKI